MGMCVRASVRRCVNKTFRNGGASADGSRSQSHKAGAFRNGGASADVSRRRGRRLQGCPPLECSVRSDELPVSMRMHFCRGPMRMTLSCSACTCVSFLINCGIGTAPTYKSCIRMERFAKLCQCPRTNTQHHHCMQRTHLLAAIQPPPQRIDLRSPSSSTHNIPKYRTRIAPIPHMALPAL